mmetsp:Transcript_38199/g.97050  ORF Transcript_38199/g.97050 Transcript_38199/m.97050 type:complete len:253 (+) Transcript_38199:58-816(+)
MFEMCGDGGSTGSKYSGARRSVSACRPARCTLVRMVCRSARIIVRISWRFSSAWTLTSTPFSHASHAASNGPALKGAAGSKRCRKRLPSAATCGWKLSLRSRSRTWLRVSSGWSSSVRLTSARQDTASALRRPSLGCAAASASVLSSTHLKRRRSEVRLAQSTSASPLRTSVRSRVTPRLGRPGWPGSIGSSTESTCARRSSRPCMLSSRRVCCSAGRLRELAMATVSSVCSGSSYACSTVTAASSVPATDW